MSPWLIFGAVTVAASWPWVQQFGSALERHAPRWVNEALPAVLLLGAIVWTYPELAIGTPPTGVDNGYHLLKAIETEQLLHSHRLFGWSDMEFAGFPHNVHYPLAGTLLTAGLHALPGVSLARAYGWSVFLAVVLVVFAVYVAARLHLGRATGFLAALFALFDPGAWWIGGHWTTVYAGMWIQSVSTALLLVALALWPFAIRPNSTRALIGAGLLLGLAVLFHPQALLLLAAVSLPLLLSLLSTSKQLAREVILRSAILGAIAFSICAFWLVPDIAHRGSAGLPSYEPPGSGMIWDQLITGVLYTQPPIWMGATLCGIFALARREQAFSRFIALAVPATAVLCSREGLEFLHLRDPANPAAIDALQLTRVFFLIRPLAMIAAAYVVAGPFAKALRKIGGRGPTWTMVLTRGFVAFCVGLFLHDPGPSIPGKPATSLPLGLSGQSLTDYEHALDAAATHMQPDDRLALWVDGPINHDLVFPTALRGLKQFNISVGAATTFKGRFSTIDPELLGRTGVTALITRGVPPQPLRDLPVVGQFGEFELRQLERKPRAWIQGGPGTLELLAFNAEEVRVRVTGSTPGQGRVALGLANYDAWKLDDGSPAQPLQIREATLTQLPIHDGELVLRYVPPVSQWIGAAITLLGALGLVAWTLRDKLLSLMHRPSTVPATPPTAA